MRSAVLIVGFGNPQRQDDALGWIAANSLDGLCPGAEVIACRQLTPEMAEDLSSARAVIFIDAVRTLPPGRIELKTLDADPNGCQNGHHLTPGGLLAIADKLHGRTPLALLLAAGGEQFGHGETLSPSAQATIPEIINRVRALVDRMAVDAPVCVLKQQTS